MRISAGICMCFTVGVILVCSSCDKRESDNKSEGTTMAKKTSSDVVMSDPLQIDGLMMQGRQLSAQQAQELEKELDSSPEDVSTRIKLLPYCWGVRRATDSAGEEHRKHVFWFIENHPGSRVAGTVEMGISQILQGQAYESAKQLWLKQVDAFGDNANVLGNASTFFLLHDREIAEKLLKKAQEIEPDNSEWAGQLARLYDMDAIASLGKPVEGSASKALEQHEKGYDGTSSDEARFYMLDGLAKAALRTRDLQKAETYANKLLEQAKQYKEDWNYGNAIHHGNMVLGNIALLSDDIDKAKEHLIKAGETPGSPQLNSFGPDIKLAKKLLDRGEKETALAYFRLCRKFWEMGQDDLDTWIDDIKQGKIPDLGRHLYR